MKSQIKTLFLVLGLMLSMSLPASSALSLDLLEGDQTELPTQPVIQDLQLVSPDAMSLWINHKSDQPPLAINYSSEPINMRQALPPPDTRLMRRVLRRIQRRELKLRGDPPDTRIQS